MATVGSDGPRPRAKDQGSDGVVDEKMMDVAACGDLVPDSLVPKLHIWSKNMEYAVVVKHATVHIHKADN
jgi:hypothetical protein